MAWYDVRFLDSALRAPLEMTKREWRNGKEQGSGRDGRFLDSARNDKGKLIVLGSNGHAPDCNAHASPWHPSPCQLG